MPDLLPAAHRHIRCRTPLITPKGEDRQWLELQARKFHDSGCRIELTPGLGHNTAKLNRFLKALQQELIHREGWPTAG